MAKLFIVARYEECEGYDIKQAFTRKDVAERYLTSLCPSDGYEILERDDMTMEEMEADLSEKQWRVTIHLYDEPCPQAWEVFGYHDDIVACTRPYCITFIIKSKFYTDAIEEAERRLEYIKENMDKFKYLLIPCQIKIDESWGRKRCLVSGTNYHYPTAKLMVRYDWKLNGTHVDPATADDSIRTNKALIIDAIDTNDYVAQYIKNHGLRKTE